MDTASSACLNRVNGVFTSITHNQRLIFDLMPLGNYKTPGINKLQIGQGYGKGISCTRHK